MSNSMVGREEIPFGTIIDNRYIIQKILGQGGLGRTYLAFDTHRFNEPCVLKEFAPLGSGQHDLEKSRDLFKREAKILHQISHPQIPKFLACFEGQGRLFLVQEYVKGKTFSALLKQRQRQGMTFSEVEAMEWLMNLLPVLDYIHKRGIIHRDISPDNIMQPDGEELPVLIDFGVGKLTNVSYLGEERAASSSHNSFVGKMSFVGKIGYAPREQISMGRCSSSSDLYSLGVTAIVLLTGREPTLLLDQYSLEWQWRDYARVSQLFGQILDKMIEDRPVKRYQSAQDVLVHLQQLKQQQRIALQATSNLRIQDETEEENLPFFDASEQTIIMNSSSVPSRSQTSLFVESDLIESTEDEKLESGDSLVFQPQHPTQPSRFSNSIEETMIVNSTNPSVSKSPSSIYPAQSEQKRKQSGSMPPVSPSGAYRSSHTSVNSEFIKQCQQQLAYCIGPMASIIVEEILEQYSSLSPQELVDALSAQIPDAKKALEFKRRLFS
ncbi:serine/threonine protein kinase [Pleurocapsales cyanobacterium LEGE 06147]|nr:serine/threonine protein kinase [Pleurocapsales cyanobacterium LEGE 06147]